MPNILPYKPKPHSETGKPKLPKLPKKPKLPKMPPPPKFPPKPKERTR